MSVGCAWLSAIAMDSIRMIYHRRHALAENHKGFREVEDFTFREKLFSYLISAFVLTGIFATGMFVITFIRTGESGVHVFAGMLSIPLVLFYNLRTDRDFKLT
jgi:amino acid permease